MSKRAQISDFDISINKKYNEFEELCQFSDVMRGDPECMCIHVGTHVRNIPVKYYAQHKEKTNLLSVDDTFVFVLSSAVFFCLN